MLETVTALSASGTYLPEFGKIEVDGDSGEVIVHPQVALLIDAVVD